MPIRTSYRHNKDGSITKRTTISRKTIFGNRKSDTYVEVIDAEKVERRAKKKGCILKAIKWYFIAIVVVLLLWIVYTTIFVTMPEYSIHSETDNYIRNDTRGKAYRVCLEANTSNTQLQKVFSEIVKDDGYPFHTILFYSSDSVIDDGFSYDVAMITDETGRQEITRK